jgi:hypothetical protein
VSYRSSCQHASYHGGGLNNTPSETLPHLR